MNQDLLIAALSNDFESSSCKKILIIEDDPYWKFILAKTAHMISDSPEIFQAESSKAARDILNSNNFFDLVISDFVLGDDENGIQLWRSSARAQAMPFVLISGKSSSEILEQSGGNKNLPKLLSKCHQSTNLEINQQKS